MHRRLLNVAAGVQLRAAIADTRIRMKVFVVVAIFILLWLPRCQDIEQAGIVAVIRVIDQGIDQGDARYRSIVRKVDGVGLTAGLPRTKKPSESVE